MMHSTIQYSIIYLYSDGGKEVTVHEGKKSFQCSICCFLCYICNQRFYTNKELDDHCALVHKVHEPYKCPSCNKCFERKFDMKRHIESVHKGKIGCQICDSKLTEESNLQYQDEYVIKNKKQRKGMMVKCLDPNCAPWSPCVPCSPKNIPKNEGNKPCKCSGCGEKFNSKASFWRHKRHCIDPTIVKDY